MSQKKALPEVVEWCKKVEETLDLEEEGTDHIQEMVKLFRKISAVVHEGIDVNDEFRDSIYTELVYDDNDKEHLPIPVFSYIVPTMKTSFLLHIMLSEGQFETEVDLLMHPRVKEFLRYCKFIGPNNDETSLNRYANELKCQYIEEQVQYFPNT